MDTSYIGKMVNLAAYAPRGRGQYKEVEYYGILRFVLPAGQLPTQEMKDLRGAGYTDKSRVSKYIRVTIQLYYPSSKRLATNHLTVAMNPTWRLRLCDN